MEDFDLGAAMIMMKFLYGEVDVLDSGFVSLVHNLEPDDETDEPSEKLLTELALADSRKRRRSAGILTHGDLHPSWMRHQEAELIRAREIKRDLLCLVHVNNIADYYQVNELRTASHAAIEKLLEDRWDLKAFLAGAKLVSTEIGDLEVHRIFIKFAAQNMQQLTEAQAEAELDTSGVWELHNFGPEFAKLAAAEVEDLKQKLHDAEGRLGRPQRSRLLQPYEGTLTHRQT